MPLLPGFLGGAPAPQFAPTTRGCDRLSQIYCEPPVRTQHALAFAQHFSKHLVIDVLREINRRHLVEKSPWKSIEVRSVDANKARVGNARVNCTRTRTLDCGGRQIDAHHLLAKSSKSQGVLSRRTSYLEQAVLHGRGEHMQDLAPPQCTLGRIVVEPMLTMKLLIVIVRPV
jgi:hypothetical protein